MKTVHLDKNIFVTLVARPKTQFCWGWGVENPVDEEFRARWACLVYPLAAVHKSGAKGHTLRGADSRGMWRRSP